MTDRARAVSPCRPEFRALLLHFGNSQINSQLNPQLSLSLRARAAELVDKILRGTRPMSAALVSSMRSGRLRAADARAAVVCRGAYFARLNTISARPPEPGFRLTCLSSSPASVTRRRCSRPSFMWEQIAFDARDEVLVASSTDQVPNDATVPAMAALFSSGVPSKRVTCWHVTTTSAFECIADEMCSSRAFQLVIRSSPRWRVESNASRLDWRPAISRSEQASG